jgi:hypothetical protein
MSWLTEATDYLGLRYFSTHVLRPPAASTAAINFVFPARPSSGGGFSAQLLSLFEMTEPVHWPQFRAVGFVSGPPYHGRVAATLSVAAGHSVPYANTEFAYMESCLDQLDFAPIV